MAGDVFGQFISRIGVQVPWHVIDGVVVTDPNTLRPVRGHAFEALFDEIATEHLKCRVDPGPGGDTDIDRYITNHSGHKHSLQLKTCVLSSVRDGVGFAVALHKTHGQEKRPRNLYPAQWPCPNCPHDGGPFPDFLIVQHPANGILIVPKDQIPHSKAHPGHYADPATFRWDSLWLNRWDTLGFPSFRGRSLERRSVPRQERLPRTAEIVHLTDEEIITMWLAPENFRTIEMNLKGNLREPALAEWLQANGVDSSDPAEPGYRKYDRITSNGTRIQIKGPSRHLCDTQRRLIGVEVMGSHGQDAARRYSQEDFDYLGFVIDPQHIPTDLSLDKSSYHFCLIPTHDLPLHHRNVAWGTTGKLYENCKFLIRGSDVGVFLVPFTGYVVPVTFRGSGPWFIDKVPSRI